MTIVATRWNLFLKPNPTLLDGFDEEEEEVSTQYLHQCVNRHLHN